MDKSGPLEERPDRRTYPDPAMDAALREFMHIFSTQLGNVQLLDLVETHALLSIVAQQGFEKPFLTAFAVVSAEHGTACGRALRTGHTAAISDVETDAEYEPYRAIARAAGYRSVISTPIRTSWGHNIGVISTHFQNPGEPSGDLIEVGEAFARQLAHDILQRGRRGTGGKTAYS